MNNINNNVAVIINTCKSFYETTIPIIINSAKNANIPLENIYVVVGESDTTTDIIRVYGYNIVFCEYINIDYNGVIYFTQTQPGLKELNKYTHFFYTHDTTEFLPYFWVKVNKLANQCNEYIKSKATFTQNIGLLNTKWFIENKKLLFETFVNLNPNLKLQYKESQYPNLQEIYDKFGRENLPPYLGEDALFGFKNFRAVGEFTDEDKGFIQYKINKYNKERNAVVYIGFGIIKYCIWSLHKEFVL